MFAAAAVLICSASTESLPLFALILPAAAVCLFRFLASFLLISCGCNPRSTVPCLASCLAVFPCAADAADLGALCGALGRNICELLKSCAEPFILLTCAAFMIRL